MSSHYGKVIRVVVISTMVDGYAHTPRCPYAGCPVSPAPGEGAEKQLEDHIFRKHDSDDTYWERASFETDAIKVRFLAKRGLYR